MILEVFSNVFDSVIKGRSTVVLFDPLNQGPLFPLVLCLCLPLGFRITEDFEVNVQSVRHAGLGVVVCCFQGVNVQVCKQRCCWEPAVSSAQLQLHKNHMKYKEKENHSQIHSLKCFATGTKKTTVIPTLVPLSVCVYLCLYWFYIFV